MELASARNYNHLGLSIDDIKATRKLKKKKLNHNNYHLGSLIVVTRVHCNSSISCSIDIDKIVDFTRSCCDFADKILILIGLPMELLSLVDDIKKAIDDYQQVYHVEAMSDKVQLEVVTPWVGFTTPLNVGIRLAIDEGYDHILFQVKNTLTLIFQYIC